MNAILDYFERVQTLISGFSPVEIERYDERVVSPEDNSTIAPSKQRFWQPQTLTGVNPARTFSMYQTTTASLNVPVRPGCGGGMG
jgi:hypothetical protein